MKRVLALILAAAVSLPVIAATGSCDSSALSSAVLSLANPECLAKAGLLN